MAIGRWRGLSTHRPPRFSFQLQYEPVPEPEMVVHWHGGVFDEGCCQNELHRHTPAQTIITISILEGDHQRVVSKLLACQRCEGALRQGARFSTRSAYDDVATFALD